MSNKLTEITVNQVRQQHGLWLACCLKFIGTIDEDQFFSYVTLSFHLLFLALLIRSNSLSFVLITVTTIFVKAKSSRILTKASSFTLSQGKKGSQIIHLAKSHKLELTEALHNSGFDLFLLFFEVKNWVRADVSL